jgi:hypothetical protein
MRRITMIRTLGVALGLVAGRVVVAAVAAAPPQQPRNFVAPLSGDEEVPAVATNARGVAIFQLSPDGTQLSYRLIASNIDNILQAHIHARGAAGVNAPVVAFLYPDNPPAVLIPGRHDGTLATGTITSADLIGPLAGMTLVDLLDAISDGDAYVNVHTTANPGGEIRGQLP